MPDDFEPFGHALEPGQYVRLSGAPDWGVGQVQSVAGDRVTVNFENAGKRLIDIRRARLEMVGPATVANR